MEKRLENKRLSIVLDGCDMKTKEELMSNMKEAFSIPDYFGMNWDALDEVLTDLSWLEDIESIDICFTNYDQVLSSAIENDRIVFKEILDSTTHYWEKEGKRWSYKTSLTTK